MIRREFQVEEGDAFDPSMLKRSEEKLQSLGYFESVNVNVRQGSTVQNAIVDIDVKGGAHWITFIRFRIFY